MYIPLIPHTSVYSLLIHIILHSTRSLESLNDSSRNSCVDMCRSGDETGYVAHRDESFATPAL
jgi:hypothetical protein